MKTPRQGLPDSGSSATLVQPRSPLMLGNVGTLTRLVPRTCLSCLRWRSPPNQFHRRDYWTCPTCPRTPCLPWIPPWSSWSRYSWMASSRKRTERVKEIGRTWTWPASQPYLTARTWTASNRKRTERVEAIGRTWTLPAS